MEMEQIVANSIIANKGFLGYLKSKLFLGQSGDTESKYD